MTLKKLFITIAITAIFSCTPNSGTITETDSGIVGKVRYSSGTGAAHAKVQLFGARDTSRLAVSSASTDQNGNYDFHKLTPGAYNVWIESQDSLLALIDSVYVPQDSEVTANATLYRGGSVTAVVALQPGHSPTSVFVQALGTQRFSNVNDSGWFTVKGLAQGEYTLRLVSTIPGYTPTYKSVTIASGVNDTLGDTIYMVYSGIPIVTGIQAVFDDYTGIARISWRKATYRDFYEYKVYREEKGALNPQPVLIAISTDSGFIYDTLYRPKVPDSVYGANDTTLYANVNYRYRVTVVNKSMDEGEKYEFADVAGKDPAGLVTMLTPLQNEKFKDSAGIKCSWDKILAAVKYQIQVSKEADFSSMVLDTITPDTVQSLPPLGVSWYYLRIRPQNTNNEWGFWSIVKKFAAFGNLFHVILPNPDNIVAECVLNTPDGGFLISGTNTGSLLLIKTDSLGNEVWRKSYPLQISNTNLILNENSGYVIYGSLQDSAKTYETILFAVDNDGNQTLKKILPTKFRWPNNANSLMRDFAGGFIIGGVNMSDINLSFGTACLMRLNSTGDSLWQIRLDAKEAVSIASYNSSSFALFTCDTNAPSQTFTMNVVDFNGSILSKKTNSVTTNFPGFLVIQNANGDYDLFASRMMMLGRFKVSKNGDLAADPVYYDVLGTNDIKVFSNGDILMNSELEQYNPRLSILKIVKATSMGTELWTNIPENICSSLVIESRGSIVAVCNRNTDNGIGLYRISKEGLSFEK